MLKQLLHGQRALVWYVLLVFGLPLLTLVALGIVKLWQNQWLIPVSMAWLLTTLTGYLLYRYWPASWHIRTGTKYRALTKEYSGTTNEELLEPLPSRLEERTDWTAMDRRVWVRCVQTVEHALGESPDWKAMPELCLAILTNVSENYNDEQNTTSGSTLFSNSKSGNAYSFTLPEVLLVLSVTTSRYRHLLLAHVPFADKLKVSALLSLHARQNQIRQGAGWLNNVRRAARLVNPVAAVAAELRDQFTNRIFTNLSDKVQHDLKRLLLQEVVQVGMDLYSGRLKNSAEEMAGYRSATFDQDMQNKVEPTEPLRIVLVGQVSSGKSSLVNALIQRLEAETDILPTTDRTTVHELVWPKDIGSKVQGQNHAQNQNQNDTQLPVDAPPEPIHLIDTVGLTDSPESVIDLSEILHQADLMIWVARATQPARAAEFQLYQQLQQRFEQDPSRRPPPMLLVLTYADQLRPKEEWQPPYDLASQHPKAANIKLALDSCLRQISLPDNTPAVPVCLAGNREHYNVDEVAAQIMLLNSDATHAQLNRRRAQRNLQTGGWRERWEQASKLGKVSGKLIARSVLGNQE